MTYGRQDKGPMSRFSETQVSRTRPDTRKRLQLSQVKRLPLVQPALRLLEQISHCVVVCYDKELRVPFKVTPSMLNRAKPPNRKQSTCCRAHMDSAYAQQDTGS
jgi:hypothetical protein